MQTLREKAPAAGAIPAGVPVYFNANGDVDLTSGAGGFAGISAQACDAGEDCYFVPPTGEALIRVPDGATFKGAQLVFFATSGAALDTYSVTAAGDTNDVIARVVPSRGLDGTPHVAAPSGADGFIAVTVLYGLPV